MTRGDDAGPVLTPDIWDDFDSYGVAGSGSILGEGRALVEPKYLGGPWVAWVEGMGFLDGPFPTKVDAQAAVYRALGHGVVM